MNFRFFKKARPEVVTEKVEVEVKVPSRFTFAHEDITVLRYFMQTSPCHTPYASVGAEAIFTFTAPISVRNQYGEVALCPVFRMPKTMPVTKLISPKRVVCIGCLIKDIYNDEIIAWEGDLVGETLESVCETYYIDMPNDVASVVEMDPATVIRTEEILNDVSYDEFARFVALTDNIKFVTKSK